MRQVGDKGSGSCFGVKLDDTVLMVGPSMSLPLKAFLASLGYLI